MIQNAFATKLSHRATVLLIDDDEGDRKFWSDALRKSSFQYSVLEAEAGDTGLNLYRHQTVDCVVLDLDMPQSGFFTLVRLVPARKRPSIPVVILTRLMHPDLVELLMKYGAYACLIKQHSSTEDLANTIQQAMRSLNSPREEHAKSD
jgi:CheY-like chemotaxis protein